MFDLADEGLIKFMNPMARLAEWPDSTRIGRGSRFRITASGLGRVKRLEAASAGQTINVYGNVGQLAGRDVITQITVTQEIVDLALQELDRRRDLDDATREAARSRIERFKGRTLEVFTTAAGTDVGALALDLVKHVLRGKGISF